MEKTTTQRPVGQMPGIPGGRKPGSYQWYEIQDNIAYWQEFEQSKIVYPNICKRNEFSWDKNGYFVNQKAFIIPQTSQYLLAILNSSVVTFLFQMLLAKLQNDFYEPSAIFMKLFSIPPATPTQQADIETLVQRILDNPHSEAVADLEAEINEQVYRLYGLTRDERTVIDTESM